MPEKVPNAVSTLLHQPDNGAFGVVTIFGNEVCNMTSRHQILSDQQTKIYSNFLSRRPAAEPP
jgi:hypothetical protein